MEKKNALGTDAIGNDIVCCALIPSSGVYDVAISSHLRLSYDSILETLLYSPHSTAKETEETTATQRKAKQPQ